VRSEAIMPRATAPTINPARMIVATSTTTLSHASISALCLPSATAVRRSVRSPSAEASSSPRNRL
jgi:hypothetical protein